MACVKIIDSIKIFIYQRDHNPPHFHVQIAEFEELIVIETLMTYSGSIPRGYRKKVIEWAQDNQEYLIENWKLLNERK